jgi:hypothetical protein
MKWPHRGVRLAAAIAILASVVAAVGHSPALATSQPVAAGPTIVLMPAQNVITLEQAFQGEVYLDPGVWVASLGSALEFDVRRASYTKPVTVTQIVHLPGGGTRTRPLPGRLVDGFNGLRDFVSVRVTNAAGKIVASAAPTFCLNTPDPERAVLASAVTSAYPQICAADPFPLAMVMGIARGWAVDPFEASGSFVRLPLGTYTATVTVTSTYRRLLNIPALDAVARVKLIVVKATASNSARPRRGAQPGPVRRALPLLPRSVPDLALASLPKADLPDLVPLPAWGISSQHTGSTDLLLFSATVWVGGGSPLDVQGLRSHGSAVMQAYQYIWHDGRVIGRFRVGTMGFAEYNHWHFQQFARYTMLAADHKAEVESHKEGFCIGATDPVDLLLPAATWQPPSTGLAGACGSPTALWVREYLQVGWGDTYTQGVVGQAFDITGLPNGTYYIEVIANPQHLLREQNTSNDISLRKVILGGTPGHRTVRAPAWHGIDPES